MAGLLIKFVGDQPLMRVLAAFLRTSRPRYLRELAAGCELSPGGVSDILRRLSALGVLRTSRQGNRRGYMLRLDRQEREVLEELFALYEAVNLELRAETFGKRAQDKLEWMDEAYSYFRQVKGIRI